ncbi:MAG: hypothetical protein AAF502_11030 [Bacteroidota bacterium]
MRSNAIMFYTVVAMILLSCNQPLDQSNSETASIGTEVSAVAEKLDGLDPYWTQGKAEINRYALTQNRYNDLHPGEVVLIFVSEHFHADKQVKSNDGTGRNVTQILKTNMTRRFTTGLYDYHIMTSVFSSENQRRYPHALKVNMSTQDWCGHSFMQINNRKRKYEVQLNSYFESEADKKFSTSVELMEDELFNMIRLNPDKLPTGNLDIFPSTTYLRLMHVPFEAVRATAEKGKYTGREFRGKKLDAYKVKFHGLQRELEIVYERKHPHKIIGWTDTYPSAFDKVPRATIAKLDESILDPYWIRNNLDDKNLRRKLDVKGFDR